MTTVRIALANLRYPASPDESVMLATRAISDAATARAELLCFPECFVPGYRRPGKPGPAPDVQFLERAWNTIAKEAGRAGVGVILGTERFVGSALLLTAMVINRDGTVAGFQDKVQLDPSEEGTYSAGSGRRVFENGPLKFGIVICHEGWRYPETVRWAARQGAHIVFHPHFGELEPENTPPPFSPTPQTRFTKRRACAAPPRTLVTSRPSIARAKDRPPRRRLLRRTARCSPISRTARKACSSRTSIPRRPQDFWPNAGSPPEAARRSQKGHF